MIFQQVKIRDIVLTAALGAALIVFLSVGTAAASDQSAVWVAGDKLQGFFADRECSKAPSKEALSVGRNFKDFCSRWIGNKNNYSRKNVRTKKTGSCNVKEYSQCSDAYELKVTKADNSHVYVGTLKYIEKVFQTDADTAGKPESFALAAEVPVTEFFMFIDGKWRY